jgi:hypothetical protein
MTNCEFPSEAEIDVRFGVQKATLIVTMIMGLAYIYKLWASSREHDLQLEHLTWVTLR